jgi:hypothetical protein
VVADEQRSVLETLIRSQTAPHRDVQRAMALLMASDGFANTRIASEVGVSATTVMNWPSLGPNPQGIEQRQP